MFLLYNKTLKRILYSLFECAVLRNFLEVFIYLVIRNNDMMQYCNNNNNRKIPLKSKFCKAT